ncbi:MAG: DUF1697 domain-containing protein [Acidobacteriota bacterium]|nr:DUF1697 domain-containing protein [Acidobacteriota bacterium]
MALVVFLRGANVGGHRVFQPAALAREMEEFGVVNVGAVGTFVVRKAVGENAFRAELAARLPFETEAMIVPARDLLALAESDPFPKTPPGDDVRRMLTVLARKPKAVPRFPLEQPAGDRWQVRVIGISDRFVLSFWRPDRKRLIYFDSEKDFGVSGTNRTWNTVEKIRKILQP